MIIEFLVSAGLGIWDVVISLLPDFDYTGFAEACDYFFNILSGVCYFLPMGTVSAIFSIIYGLFLFRLLVSSLKALWSIIPIL